MKVDVLIPTKDPEKIRPRLLQTLKKASWVNNIVLETSKPLSIARAIGARKCSTEWIAMFDDDVEIPENWFEVVSKYIGPGIVAISTPSFDVNNIHMMAYKIVVDKIRPLHTRDTPFIDNTLIRRDILLNYYPPPVFYGEDEILYRFAKKRGRWVHPPPCGVKHFLMVKSNVEEGSIKWQLGLYPLRRFVRSRLAYFLIPILAIAYSHTLRTVVFFWRINIKILAGYMKARIGL
ncbi:MAG: glycosyltransferase [Nitrososphaerota archaeon]|nr:glycosyltransferase [Candidatus Bathyarchaeota archaeon]MDW8049369.1 glycosyltransferase [Nitrososphaerota archaeon]